MPFAAYFQVLTGLGEALLSDEKLALGKNNHSPFNSVQKIMAALVIQRSYMQYMARKRGNITMHDVVLAAEKSAGIRRPTKTLTPPSRPIRKRPSAVREGTRLSQSGYGGRDMEDDNGVRLTNGACKDSGRKQSGVSATESIFLPPGEEEIANILRKRLVQSKQWDEEEDAMTAQAWATRAAVRDEAAVATSWRPSDRGDGRGHSDRGEGVGPVPQRKGVTTGASVQNTPAAATSPKRGGLRGARHNARGIGRDGDDRGLTKKNPVARWFRSIRSRIWNGGDEHTTPVGNGRVEDGVRAASGFFLEEDDSGGFDEERAAPGRFDGDQFVSGRFDAASGGFDEKRASPGEKEKKETQPTTVPMSELALWLKQKSAF